METTNTNKTLTPQEQQQRRPSELPQQQQLQQQQQQQEQRPSGLLQTVTEAPRRKRISGAQQRKRQRARQEQAANTATGTVPKPPTGTVQARQPKPQGSGGHLHTSDKKRQRSDGSSPRNPPPKRKPGAPSTSGVKQPARTHTGRYSDMVANHLRVAIIDKQNWDNNSLGQLTATQVETLKKCLSQKLDNTLIEGGPTPPTFRTWTYTQETLKITCENEASLDWLRQAVKSLPPLWEGAKLEIVPVDQLPKLTKVTLWVPGPPDETDVVMRRLAAQNPWAKVREWITFHTSTKDEPEGRILVFGLREMTCSTLKQHQGRLSYMFNSLRAKIHASGTEAKAEVANPTPMDVVDQGPSTSASTPTAETEGRV